MKQHPEMYFLQDNAPCHGKGAVESKAIQFLRKNKIKYLQHPPNSPDLNMIEFVWRDIKQSEDVALCQTKEEIVAAYEAAWKKYSCVLGMPGMMKKLVETKGYSAY